MLKQAHATSSTSASYHQLILYSSCPLAHLLADQVDINANTIFHQSPHFALMETLSKTNAPSYYEIFKLLKILFCFTGPFLPL